MRVWYAKMDSYMLSQKFVHCKSDPNVYMIRIDFQFYSWFCMLMICWSLVSRLQWFLQSRGFFMTSYRWHAWVHYISSLYSRSVKMHQASKLSQEKYAWDLLEIFHMKNFKSTPTPFLSIVILEDGGYTPLVDNTLYIHLVGSLLFLAHSRPNLSYAVGAVSKFMQESHELHWKNAKCILQYVQGTITFWIHCAEDSTLDLIEFTDYH